MKRLLSLLLSLSVLLSTAVSAAAASNYSDLISGVLGSRLHVGVENRKNAFKLPIFRSLRRKETHDRIQKDISLIRVVIDSALDYVPDEPVNVNS